jgi:prolipoprotein diacylglyceryltransferase
MNEALIRINNVPVYGYGILAVLSFLWGAFVFHKKASESHFDDHMILDSVVLSAFWSFIVGRVVYCLSNPSIFWNHWTRLLLLTNYPGINRFGAFVGIAVGLWLCIRKTKEKFLDWFDLMLLQILILIYIGLPMEQLDLI